jgi:hypothetical protein
MLYPENGGRNFPRNIVSTDYTKSHSTWLWPVQNIDLRDVIVCIATSRRMCQLCDVKKRAKACYVTV